MTSSIFSRVGGAATRLAAAAATKSPTPDSPAVVAAQPDMYWDAQRNTWMTRQASGPGDASASAAQAEMVSVYLSRLLASLSRIMHLSHGGYSNTWHALGV